jgi:hypothetical protein
MVLPSWGPVVMMSLPFPKLSTAEMSVPSLGDNSFLFRHLLKVLHNGNVQANFIPVAKARGQAHQFVIQKCAVGTAGIVDHEPTQFLPIRDNCMPTRDVFVLDANIISPPIVRLRRLPRHQHILLRLLGFGVCPIEFRKLLLGC